MSTSRPGPSKPIPTLTEVVVLPVDRRGAPEDSNALGQDEFAPTMFSANVSQPGDPFDEEELIQRILAELQRQVDLMLEYRLREALAPALARATDALIRDTRNELAQAMRDLVSRAVAQELSRHREA